MKKRMFANGKPAPKGSERAYDAAMRGLMKTKSNYAVVKLASGKYQAVQWLHNLELPRVERALGFKFIGGIIILS